MSYIHLDFHKKYENCCGLGLFSSRCALVGFFLNSKCISSGIDSKHSNRRVNSRANCPLVSKVINQVI